VAASLLSTLSHAGDDDVDLTEGRSCSMRIANEWMRSFKDTLTVHNNKTGVWGLATIVCHSSVDKTFGLKG
jgi:hypothetical protein